VLQPFTDAAAQRDLEGLAAVAISDQDFVDGWLRLRDLRVIPEESGLHFDEDQRARLSSSLNDSGVTRLAAVATEELGTASTWTLDPTPNDLAAFTYRCGMFDYLLFDREALTVVVYCSSQLDTLLVAGSEEFLRSYFGDLHRAVAEFWTFSETHVESLRPKLRTYLRHAAWADPLADQG
jgi:hypothetical protein